MSFSPCRFVCCLLLAGLLFCSAPVHAQDGPRGQAGDVTAVLIEGGPIGTDDGEGIRPSVTISTPTAFGAGWGQVYAGLSYQDRLRYSDWHDGIITVGAGAGNPARTVGLAATVHLLDTYTDFGKDRSLSLKLHRRLPYRSAIAVGYENIWHTRGTDGGDSHYVVASTVVPLRSDPGAPLGLMVVSAGLGDDRFLAEERFARAEGGVNAFGSLAVRFLRSVNGLVNWTGQDLNLGLSIAPHRALPIVFTPAVLDVTGRAGDGARVAVSVSAGVNLRR